MILFGRQSKRDLAAHSDNELEWKINPLIEVSGFLLLARLLMVTLLTMEVGKDAYLEKDAIDLDLDLLSGCQKEDLWECWTVMMLACYCVNLERWWV